MAGLFGFSLPYTFAGATVHPQDVATMHVEALDAAKIASGSYIASSSTLDGIKWGDSFDIVKKHFPKEIEAGILKVDESNRPGTTPIRVDNSLATKVFGIKWIDFEAQVIDVVKHFLEISGVASKET